MDINKKDLNYLLKVAHALMGLTHFIEKNSIELPKNLTNELTTVTKMAYSRIDFKSI